MSTNFRQFETEVGGRKVIVETGKYAEQANGSCVVRCGDTVVMVNVTMSETPREGMDFFPLQVDFEEKMYAVGKIPGGFKKREGRASDKGILTSRLIDRPIRPLFPKGLYNDVVVIATALSVDTNIPPEPFAMMGSSIALSISDIPWAGPTGSVQVGLVDGQYVINPDNAQREKSTLNLGLSGTKDAIMMVEAGAKEISDEEMVGEAVSLMRHKPVVGTGKFSIGELAAAIRRCSLFITNDSGPMHIAVSQRVPLVALYGPSNPEFYGPYTDRAIVLESTTHYEVGKSMKKIIKEGKYKGISVIPLSQVIQAGEELLERYKEE